MRSTLLMLCFMITSMTFPNVSLPSIFSDHMVLQRNAEVKIWGWAKPGEEITIKTSWGSEMFSTKANKNAMWEILINTPDVRGAQEINIKGYNEIILKNVLLGEVWLVSGQSNMEWSAAAGIENAEEAIAGAHQPDIRFFQVAHRTANAPQNDLDGKWVASTPETMEHFSAIAYFFGKKIKEELGIPVGLINSSWGGTPAEVWMPAEIIETSPQLLSAAKSLPEVEWGPTVQGKLYNAMIAPLTPFKLAGVLWYQGESNTDNADHYELIFSSLINSWREKWSEQLPFLYAQIAPFNYDKENAGVKVRDAQRRVLKLHKTGMVITSDIGNTEDIHPRNKYDVGLRFANLALAEVYGKNIKAYAPIFDRASSDGKNLVVYFNHADGLKFAEMNPESQFEIAGKDKIFHRAKAKIKDEKVILNSPKVPQPVFVRFSWGNTVSSNIFNDSNLPASSFTTEY